MTATLHPIPKIHGMVPNRRYDVVVAALEAGTVALIGVPHWIEDNSCGCSKGQISNCSLRYRTRRD